MHIIPVVIAGRKKWRGGALFFQMCRVPNGQAHLRCNARAAIAVIATQTSVRKLMAITVRSS